MQDINTGVFYVGNNWTVLVKFDLGEVFDNISLQHLKLIEPLHFSSKPSQPSINNAVSLETGSFSKQLLRSKGCGGARIHTRAVGRQRQMKMKGRLKGQRYTKEFKQALWLLHLGACRLGTEIRREPFQAERTFWVTAAAAQHFTFLGNQYFALNKSTERCFRITPETHKVWKVVHSITVQDCVYCFLSHSSHLNPNLSVALMLLWLWN